MREKESISTLAATLTKEALEPLVSKKRRIGVDIQTLEHWETGQRGIGRYTISHITEIMRLTPHWEYIFFSKKDPATHFGAPLLSSSPSAKWMECGKEQEAGLDLFHVPDQMSLLPYYIPPLQLAPKTIPCTVLFHDLIPLILRHAYLDTWDPQHARMYLHRLEMLTASHATVLTNSECTKRDLVRLGSIPERCVFSVMAGSAINDSFTQNQARWDKVKNDLSLNEPYLIYVGGAEEHKGLIPALQSWLNARSINPQLKIVIVGSAGDPWKVAIQKHLADQGVTGAVFSGFLPDDELWELYSRALALIFPSKYEGFGFPVLEAMKLGTPVIGSNAASIPEVIGPGGLTFAPDDIDGFSKAIINLLQDESLRAKLSEYGKQQAGKLTWNETAKKTLAVWNNLIGV